MKRFIVAALAAVALVQGAWAHRIDEFLQATLLHLSADEVTVSMRLIPGVQVAQAILGDIDRDGDGSLSADEQRAYAQRVVADMSLTFNGTALAPRLVSWNFPSPAQMRAGIGEIHIEYSASLPTAGPARRLVLENHHRQSLSVYLMNVLSPEDRSIGDIVQVRDERQARYELDYQQQATPTGAVTARTPALRIWIGDMHLLSLFQLGVRHIAEGTDHLLFLLTLLLPAPLLAVRGRWTSPMSVGRSLQRVAVIVTAFTVGHSLTLLLAALTKVSIPSRLVEVLIALSILVSAAHAYRPIVAGREAWIAGFFGLIHGLAFATTLDRLGLEHWQRVAGVLSFNVGIEAMQLLVVAVTLPSLVIMSRTPWYRPLRIAGAIFAAGASVCWIAERTFDVSTPADVVTSAIAQHGVQLAICLGLSSLAAWLWQRRPQQSAVAH